MDEIREYLKSLPKSVVPLLGIGLLVFLGFSDYLTGTELSFSIFYLLPVSIVTLVSGRSLGFLVSVLGGVVWFVADVAGGAHYSHWLIPYWNATVRLGYFTLHTLLLSSLIETIQQREALSRQDPLTNAANWKYFEEYAWRELQRARRTKQPITFAYFDLDNFKAVNDTLGHDAGDDLLRTIVEVIQGHIRPTDMVVRVGGDEFALFLPDTGYDGANRCLDRIREALFEEIKRSGWPVTLSIGAITFNRPPSSIEAMVKRADELMYSIKHGGKNNLKHEQWPQAPTVV